MTAVARRRTDVEDIYRLTPIQEGLLFHTLLTPGSGLYFEQSSVTIGSVDPDILRWAWDLVIRRHPILRSSFVWKQVDRPVQVVWRHVDVPIEMQDWAHLGEAEQLENLDRYLLADRKRGFALESPPLMRLAVFRLGPDSTQLVWSFHHILLDAWSREILVNELLHCYMARQEGREPELGSVRPFRDYVAWLEVQDQSAAEKYWRSLLGDLTVRTDLRLPQPQPGGQGFEEHFRRLSIEASAELGAFARGAGLTLNTVVLGAWAMVLSRLSGQRDVVFGSTTSGRNANLEGIESMVGLFLNTLPIRMKVDPRPGVAEWLRSQLTGLSEARRYEYSSLVDIQRWSGVPPGQPLFETIIVYQNSPRRQRQASDQPAQIDSQKIVQMTNYPVTLIVSPGEQVGLDLVVDGSRVDRASAVRMLDQFETLLEAIPRQSQRPLGELPTLTTSERAQLARWNATGRRHRACVWVSDLIQARTHVAPAAPALVLDGRALSYADLDRRSNRLARRLIGLGVRPEQPVGICMRRSPEMVVGLLAIMRAKAVSFPLDPMQPGQRLARIVRSSGIQVLISEDRSVDWTFDGQIVPIGHDVEGNSLAPEAGDPLPDHRVSSDNLACIMLVPTPARRTVAVEITHGGLLNLLSALSTRLAIGSHDAMLWHSPPASWLSVLETYLPLVAGARVVIAPDDAADEQLGQLVEGSDVTVLQATPRRWRKLAEARWADGGRLQALSVGEPLPPSLGRYLAANSRRLLNLYGAPETTFGALLHEVERQASEVPIGRPHVNARAHILDSELRQVPIGVAGELFIGGDGVARGYRGRPDLTADRFLPEPAAPRPGSRMYRTGDLARRRPDGSIDFLGKTGQEVIVRGHRMRLAEIDAVVRMHPAVSDVAVTVWRGPDGGARLVAYVVPLEGTASSEQAINRWLAERLPEHMRPTWIEVGDLPLTLAGKLDRRALPAPGALRPELDVAYVGPETPTQEALCDIWRRLLDVDRVGIHDNFTKLGGHSLAALRLVSRIRERFEVEVSLQTLFERPTVAQLGAHLDKQVESPDEAALVEIQAGEVGNPLFLIHPSGGQVYCYYELASHLGPSQPVYGLAANDDVDPETFTVEEMAASYVSAIRRRQARGPYQVGGWSLGAVVAFEVGQQLRAAGEQVTTLALLDQGPPTGVPSDPVEDDVAAVLSLYPAEQTAQVRQALGSSSVLRELGPDERLLHILGELRRAGLIPEQTPVSWLQRLHRGYRARMLAMGRYVASPYDGPITLYRAKLPGGRAEEAEHDYGWGRYAGQKVEVVEVPGSHDSVIAAPQVEALAAALRQRLERAAS